MKGWMGVALVVALVSATVVGLLVLTWTPVIEPFLSDPPTPPDIIGSPVIQEADNDGDGLSDYRESQIGTDPNDPDSDHDLIWDAWEVDFGTDPLAADGFRDPDEDGLDNLAEFLNGTDPNAADSDGDGIPDGWEVRFGLDPTLDDAGLDADADRLTNLAEYLAGTDPTRQDSDGDGLGDGDEVEIWLTDPTLEDTDGDLMPDGWEVTYQLRPGADDSQEDRDRDGLANLAEFLNGTRPDDSDTDGDGMPDGWEVDSCLEGVCLQPLDASDADGDLDGDRLLNLAEFIEETDPALNDTDGDGLMDGAEVLDYGTQPTFPDTDFDGLQDGEEVLVYQTDPTRPDTDGDGLSDAAEVLIWGTDPRDRDTDDDGLSDGLELRNVRLDPFLGPQPQDALDPLNQDTDGDGLPDGWEYNATSWNAVLNRWAIDPTNPDDADGDADGDQLTNTEEYLLGTDPVVADTDGDGLPDGWEVRYSFDPLDDRDAHRDPDGPGEGMRGFDNLAEYLNGTDPRNPDSDGDGIVDPIDPTPLNVPAGEWPYPWPQPSYPNASVSFSMVQASGGVVDDVLLRVASFDAFDGYWWHPGALSLRQTPGAIYEYDVNVSVITKAYTISGPAPLLPSSRFIGYSDLGGYLAVGHLAPGDEVSLKTPKATIRYDGEGAVYLPDPGGAWSVIATRETLTYDQTVLEDPLATPHNESAYQRYYDRTGITPSMESIVRSYRELLPPDSDRLLIQELGRFLRHLDERDGASDPPPPGWNGVEWVLFGGGNYSQADLCSAHAALIRAAGFPVRLSVGYLVSDGLFGIADFRCWAEVAWVGYGWVPYDLWDDELVGLDHGGSHDSDYGPPGSIIPTTEPKVFATRIQIDQITQDQAGPIIEKFDSIPVLKGKVINLNSSAPADFATATLVQLWLEGPGGTCAGPVTEVNSNAQFRLPVLPCSFLTPGNYSLRMVAYPASTGAAFFLRSEVVVDFTIALRTKTVLSAFTPPRIFNDNDVRILVIATDPGGVVFPDLELNGSFGKVSVTNLTDPTGSAYLAYAGDDRPSGPPGTIFLNISVPAPPAGVEGIGLELELPLIHRLQMGIEAPSALVAGRSFSVNGSVRFDFNQIPDFGSTNAFAILSLQGVRFATAPIVDGEFRLTATLPAIAASEAGELSVALPPTGAFWEVSATSTYRVVQTSNGTAEVAPGLVTGMIHEDALTYTVRDGADLPVVDMTCSLLDAGVEVARRITDGDGEVRLAINTTDRSRGQRNLTVECAATTSHLAHATTVSIDLLDTTVLSVDLSSGYRNATLPLTATLISPAGPVPGIDLVFSIDGANIGEATTDRNGTAFRSYRLPRSTPSGAHLITVDFRGTPHLVAAAANATLTARARTQVWIDPLGTTTPDGTLNLSGQVREDNLAPVSSGTIQIRIQDRAVNASVQNGAFLVQAGLADAPRGWFSGTVAYLPDPGPLDPSPETPWSVIVRARVDLSFAALPYGQPASLVTITGLLSSQGEPVPDLLLQQGANSTFTNASGGFNLTFRFAPPEPDRPMVLALTYLGNETLLPGVWSVAIDPESPAPPVWPWLLGGAILVLGIIALVGIFLMVRRRAALAIPSLFKDALKGFRPGDRHAWVVLKAYRRLVRLMGTAGATVAASETSRDLQAASRSRTGVPGSTLDPLLAPFEVARYSDHAVSAADASAAEAALEVYTSAMKAVRRDPGRGL